MYALRLQVSLTLVLNVFYVKNTNVTDRSSDWILRCILLSYNQSTGLPCKAKLVTGLSSLSTVCVLQSDILCVTDVGCSAVTPVNVLREYHTN
jgi:hypothetical protein